MELSARRDATLTREMLREASSQQFVWMMTTRPGPNSLCEEIDLTPGMDPNSMSDG
jgi:hypothetical protein